MRTLVFVAIAGCGTPGFHRVDAPPPDDATDGGRDATGVPVPRNGLVGEWLFAGNANDTSGNSHNGTVQGAVLAADRFGMPMSAYHFDGISASIAVSDAPELALVGDATISVWIKPDALRKLSGIISKFQVSGDNGYALRLGENAPYGYYDFDNTMLGVATPPSMIVAGQWQHVALVIKAGAATVYANGAPGVARTPGYTVMTNPHALRFGVDFLSRWFAGSIDDVRLYSRALQDFEIEALYAERP
jgi:hypothetical protein